MATLWGLRGACPCMYGRVRGCTGVHALVRGCALVPGQAGLRKTGEREGAVIPPDSSGGYTDPLALLRNGRVFPYREGRRCPS
jgi:hypothetical protein